MSTYKWSIDDRIVYTTHSTYTVRYYRKPVLTTVTADPSIVSNWLSDIISFHHSRLTRLIVGLDVKWRAYSRRKTPVAVLQLCVGCRCLIFQILHAHNIPDSLADFLSDEDFTFVGIRVQQDLVKLQKDYNIGADANMVDLGILAAHVYVRPELKVKGVADLAMIVMGAEMEKPVDVGRSEWDSWVLTERQVMYAALDVIVAFEIGLKLDAFEYSKFGCF